MAVRKGNSDGRASNWLVGVGRCIDGLSEVVVEVIPCIRSWVSVSRDMQMLFFFPIMLCSNARIPALLCSTKMPIMLLKIGKKINK